MDLALFRTELFILDNRACLVKNVGGAKPGSGDGAVGGEPDVHGVRGSGDGGWDGGAAELGEKGPGVISIVDLKGIIGTRGVILDVEGAEGKSNGLADQSLDEEIAVNVVGVLTGVVG